MKPRSGPAMTAPPRDNVGVRAPAGQLSDLDVAEAGDEEGEIGALAVWEGGENLKRLARLQDVVDGERVGEYGVPRSGGEHRLEVEVAALAFAEPERLACGHDVEPAEDRGPLGLHTKQDRPSVLAGVLDELARGVGRVSNCSAELSVMATVELALVAARRRPLSSYCESGSGRGLHEPRRG